MDKQKQARDLKFGAKSEVRNVPFIERVLGVKLAKTSEFHTFDWVNEKQKIYVELKSRRVHRSQYPDIMIGLNKIRYGFARIEEGWKIYCVWAFEDGLAYYQLEANTFDIKWVRDGGRTDRGINELGKYVFVPTNKLINIDCSPISKSIKVESPKRSPKILAPISDAALEEIIAGASMISLS